MKQGAQRRSIKSIKITWRYYDRILLLWTFSAILPIIFFNGLIFLLAQLLAPEYAEMWNTAFPDGPSMTSAAFLFCLVNAGMIIFGVTMLALLTTHRLTGPYINIKNTCDRIQGHDDDPRLKFRKDDRLDDVQDAFNEMLDRLKKPRAG